MVDLYVEAEALFEQLDMFVSRTGLRYNYEEDNYVMDKVYNCDCDDEMLASIENAHADLKYYLGK